MGKGYDNQRLSAHKYVKEELMVNSEIIIQSVEIIIALIGILLAILGISPNGRKKLRKYRELFIWVGYAGIFGIIFLLELSSFIYKMVVLLGVGIFLNMHLKVIIFKLYAVSLSFKISK